MYCVSLPQNKGSMEKANKNLNRIKVILAEKNLQNKWLAETKLRFPNG